MPAWKNREAGRRGRREHEPRDEQYHDDSANRRSRAPSSAGRERPGDRIERLTRTATSLGNRSAAGSDGTELEAVASELDRLLSGRRGRGGDHDSAASRPERGERLEERQRLARRGASSKAGSKDNGRLDDVMGALERLDRKVETLASRPRDDEFGEPHRDYLDAPGLGAAYEDPYDRDYGEPLEDDTYDQVYDDAPESRYVYDEPETSASYASRAPRADSAPGAYKDLGRRIDALRKPQVEAFNMVRQEIGSLRDAIGGYSTVSQERVGKQNAELRRLANMVERLRVEQQDDRFAKDIRKEIAELKSLVGRTNVDGALKTLEHGYAHILQRLDELSRATIDPRVLRGVTARLNEIEDAFAVLPRGEHMLALEDRISDISERMEDLLHRHDHGQIEPLRVELRDVRAFVEQIDISGLVESIDDRMKFVSGRLDDLEILAREQRGLDTRITAMEERLPDADMLDRLQGRLEDIVGMMSDERASPLNPEKYGAVGSKLEEIVGRLDRMEKIQPQADADAFLALEERLSAISGKIDAMDKKANKPKPVLDAAAIMAAGSGGDGKAFAELQARIADLSKQLERPADSVTTADLDTLRAEIGEMRKSVAAPSSTEALEKRISDLAEAVGRGGAGLDDTRLDQLGTKVAALATQLEKASQRGEELDHVTTALARIEEGLKTTRDDVVSIAQSAATEALGEHPSARSPEYDAAIDGLQSDLRRLLDAAEGAEERTLNTFNGVQSVLSTLTDRLERLEKMGGAPAEVAGDADSREAGFFGRSLNRIRQPEADADRPADRVRDRKADFIAAARRAAQAASEEAAMLDVSADAPISAQADGETRGSERAGWLRNVLKRGKSRPEENEMPVVEEPQVSIEPETTQKDSEELLAGDRPAPEEKGSGGRRRALVFAAAAVVLTIGALQVFKLVGTTGEAPGDQDQLAVSLPETTGESAGESVDVSPEAPLMANSDTGVDLPETDGQPDIADLAAMDQGTPSVGDPIEDLAGVTSPVVPSAGREDLGSSAAPAPIASAPSPSLADAGQDATNSDSLAFAPPAGVASSFGEDVPLPNNGDLQPTPGALPASVVANLPPEEVGPMALRSAAASGNAAAAFLVGVKYTEGSSVPANLGEAAKWYRKAAEQGLAPAQYRLASLYEKGRGVERDAQLAREWYLKAAEAGNAKAMHNLAVLYAEGADGSPDFTEAAKWFESAANFGVKDSLFNLGILYARGLGVEKDLVASYKWFAIAAEQGDRDAAKKRDDVANMMEQDTLAAARLAVETFQLKTPDPAANKVNTEPGWASAASLSTNASAVLDDVVDYEGMVRKAQSTLNALGFDTGVPDGQMGPRTRSAIRAFQRSLGRAETGEVDADLIRDLESQSI
ncbi:peptidoglycan-binding protein [Roseibium sp.]|uniref:peptidoglycan-binding protein n=1 Tax=Roseibium sp. TaxID=1936156 RepID=UPI003A968B33